MKYLIDTHVCIWAIAEKQKLSKRVTEILEDEGNEIFISQLSLLEIAIKKQIGKLVDFNVTLSELIEQIHLADFQILPLKNEHTVSYSTDDFSPEHRDPFDRYLLITAITEDFQFVTIDNKFQLYKDKVKIVW